MDADDQLNAKIKKIYTRSLDWDEVQTSEEGIFIVKYPISSINQTYVGIKIKKYQNSIKGIYIRSREEITIFQNLLNLRDISIFLNRISIDKQLQIKIGLLEDWGQIPTPVLGISYTKMPNDNHSSGIPALAINPINDLGRKMKRKSLFVRDQKELDKYRYLFNNKKLDRLSRIIEEVNDELSFEMRVAERVAQSKVLEKYK